jgi:hypothetical protein
MYSHRIDKAGKKVTLVETKGSLMDHQPPFRRNMACAWGDCDEDVSTCPWCVAEGNVRCPSAQPPLPPAGPARSTLLAPTPLEHTQKALTDFISQSRLSVGDWLIYESYAYDSLHLSDACFNFVMYIEDDLEKVKWDSKYSRPNCYLMVSTTSIHQPTAPPWIRWSNALGLRHVTANELNKYIKNNVQLQDYIRQTQEAIETGKLTVN